MKIRNIDLYRRWIPIFVPTLALSYLNASCRKLDVPFGLQVYINLYSESTVHECLASGPKSRPTEGTAAQKNFAPWKFQKTIQYYCLNIPSPPPLRLNTSAFKKSASQQLDKALYLRSPLVSTNRHSGMYFRVAADLLKGVVALSQTSYTLACLSKWTVLSST